MARSRSERICTIPGCGKRHEARGYCPAHYYRLKEHGDPLGGAPQRGTIIPYIHEVVLQYRGDDCLLWPFARNSDGYGTVTVDGKTNHANRYICRLANGEPPSPKHEAAHSCGNGHIGCVTPGHLGWKTKQENEDDKVIHGTRSVGERNGQSKLTEEQARKIIHLKGKATLREIADEFGVSASAVSEIHQGRNWAWLHGGEEPQ